MKWRDLKLAAIGAAVVLAAAMLLAPPLLLTHRSDSPLELLYSDAVVSVVARVLGGDAPNPLGPTPSASDEGRLAYVGSCAACHGQRGDGHGLFGRDTYPAATDLTAPNVAAKTDAQLFWIVKNGLAFSAMPSFAARYPDHDIWALVSYVRALQKGGAQPVDVPSPTKEQLAFADPHGQAVQRGAAVYIAQGCAACHGPTGDAPGQLSLAGPASPDGVRGGGIGMPRYGSDRLSDADLSDLLAYVATLHGR